MSDKQPKPDQAPARKDKTGRAPPPAPTIDKARKENQPEDLDALNTLT